MSLFRRHEGELLDHVHGIRDGARVMLAWDVRGAAPVKVRILRSAIADAEGPDDENLLPMGQTVVYEGTATELRDDDLLDSAPCYYYTVFALDPEGEWRLQTHADLTTPCEWHWSREEGTDSGPSLARLTAMWGEEPSAR